MIYLKSILSGIGGSILGLILFIVVVVILNVMKVGKDGMVGISIIVPLGLALLGFAVGFYLVFRTSK